MLLNVILSVCFLAPRCAADLCNWTGSGSAAAPDSRIVLQVRLRCTEGSVTWFYPGQALRVLFEPNLSSTRHGTICIKPSPSFGGTGVFVERAGELQLLLTDSWRSGRSERNVFCFRTDGPRRPVIYIQASPQGSGTWIRRRMGLRYELLDFRRAAANLQDGNKTSCRPCNDSELLMAVCNSDFVVRGHIKNVSHDSGRRTSIVEVVAARVYWQRGGAFEQRVDPSESFPSWRGQIHSLLQCHVKPGDGEFLFTGSEHFGEAWLGCAPRYKDFLSVYHKARTEQRHSCDFPLD